LTERIRRIEPRKVGTNRGIVSHLEPYRRSASALLLDHGVSGSWPTPASLNAQVWPSWNYRWAHPGQQQGRRFPSLRLEQPHSIRRLLVFAFLADSIQHIHSLRASGVISSHAVNALGSDVSALFKSAGTSCTTPLEIFFSNRDKLPFVSSKGARSSLAEQRDVGRSAMARS
jgi:hypothetical protein